MPVSSPEQGEAMNTDAFDFDEWAILASSAPDVFEQRRREYVEHLIAKCNSPCRLQGLQCRIDMERMRSRTPLKSCLRLSSMMWDTFFDLRAGLDDFVHCEAEVDCLTISPHVSATIIPFKTISKERADR